MRYDLDDYEVQFYSNILYQLVSMFFPVSRNASLSLPAQIAAQIRTAVAEGTLRPGDTIASTRELAAQLGVSRGTVVSAFDQLISEGYLDTTQGAPTRIHPELRVPKQSIQQRQRASNEASTPAVLSLVPTSGIDGMIRPAAWHRAWREASYCVPKQADPQGEPKLRTAIAEHLRVARGLHVAPEEVIVTGGTREGLLLTLMSIGNSVRVGVETSESSGLRSVIALAGHATVPCQCDDEGVLVSQLPCDIDALLITPAHVPPFGGVMTVRRRVELLEWASATGTLLIEDDFNTELRYRTAPQPTLSALPNSGNVLTLGTFTTLLHKQLSAGYIVTTPDTFSSVQETREVLGMPVSTVTQHAIAHLLTDGTVRKSTKAFHTRLAKRRRQVTPLLERIAEASGASNATMSNTSSADIIVEFSHQRDLQRFREQLKRVGCVCATGDSTGAGEDCFALLSFSTLSDQDFDAATRSLTEFLGC